MDLIKELALELAAAAGEALAEEAVGAGVRSVVERLWINYDANKDDRLDKDECRNLAKDVAAKIEAKIGLAVGFDENEFACAFAAFDEDCDGDIDKEQVIDFVTNVVT